MKNIKIQTLWSRLKMKNMNIFPLKHNRNAIWRRSTNSKNMEFPTVVSSEIRNIFVITGGNIVPKVFNNITLPFVVNQTKARLLIATMTAFSGFLNSLVRRPFKCRIVTLDIFGNNNEVYE